MFFCSVNRKFKKYCILSYNLIWFFLIEWKTAEKITLHPDSSM